jgi:hypothetical protein
MASNLDLHTVHSQATSPANYCETVIAQATYQGDGLIPVG